MHALILNKYKYKNNLYIKFNPEITNSITKFIVTINLKIISHKYPELTTILTDDI